MTLVLVSTAVLTSYHKLSGLKEHVCYLTVLWVNIPTRISLGENQGVSRVAFPSGGSRGQSVPSPFPALRIPLPLSFFGSWPLPPSSALAKKGC